MPSAVGIAPSGWRQRQPASSRRRCAYCALRAAASGLPASCGRNRSAIMAERSPDAARGTAAIVGPWEEIMTARRKSFEFGIGNHLALGAAALIALAAIPGL